jgi:hypothetical protein
MSGARIKREAILDEEDELWRAMAHMHIAETASKILSEFNQFTSTHRTMGFDDHSGKEKSLREIGDVMRAMPQYQDLLSKVKRNDLNDPFILSLCNNRFPFSMHCILHWYKRVWTNIKTINCLK